MKLTNFEFKARLRNEKHVRTMLRKLRARFVGTDRQVDTYFRVSFGRLKVREGRIENALIFYQRSNTARARPARIEMVLLTRPGPIRSILAAALGVLAVVEKRREIYFVGNVKIHLDRVRGLGKFAEVEAVSRRGDSCKIRRQARAFQKLFAIPSSQLVAYSYSDLILQKSGS